MKFLGKIKNIEKEHMFAINYKDKNRLTIASLFLSF